MKRYEPGNVRWRDVWDVVRESAERRLGSRVLKAYLVMVLVAAAIVLGAVAAVTVE